MPTLTALPWWLRQGLIGLGLFLAGGLISFGYSYRPLHGEKNWKIEHLESRLDEVNRENLALSDELAGLRSSEASKVDPETLAQVERELGKTQKALSQVEKNLERAEKKRKEAASGASRWRQRYEELRDSQAAMPAAPTPAPEPAAPTAGESPTPLTGAELEIESPRPGTTGFDPDPSRSMIGHADPTGSVPASPGVAEKGILGASGSSSPAQP